MLCTKEYERLEINRNEDYSKFIFAWEERFKNIIGGYLIGLIVRITRCALNLLCFSLLSIGLVSALILYTFTYTYSYIVTRKPSRIGILMEFLDSCLHYLPVSK